MSNNWWRAHWPRKRKCWHIFGRYTYWTIYGPKHACMSCGKHWD